MRLTTEEKDMLSGKEGHATKKSMEILVALGEIYGAKRLVPVSSVQVSGVSYKNLGDAGIEFLRELAEDGRARVKTTLNPAGMDLTNWKLQGIDSDFAEQAAGDNRRIPEARTGDLVHLHPLPRRKRAGLRGTHRLGREFGRRLRQLRPGREDQPRGRAQRPRGEPHRKDSPVRIPPR